MLWIIPFLNVNGMLKQCLQQTWNTYMSIEMEGINMPINELKYQFVKQYVGHI